MTARSPVPGAHHRLHVGRRDVFSRLYLNAHEDEVEDIICCIDLDMVGEDPAKTGGPMRIEKAPIPPPTITTPWTTSPRIPSITTTTAATQMAISSVCPTPILLWGAGDPGDS